MSDGKSQGDLILAYLERHANQWISVFDIIRAGRTLSHTKRVSEIKARGYVIINRKNKQNHSEYKLVKSGEQLRLIA